MTRTFLTPWKSSLIDTSLHQNGKKSGEGILKFANGDVYQGDWIGDHMQGIGQYVFTSGDRYKGQITDAKFGPIGEFWYRNGDHYNGEWKVIHCLPTFQVLSEILHDVILLETNQDLKRHGHGTFKYANGDVFTGSWHMGEIQGKGQLRYVQYSLTVDNQGVNTSLLPYIH